MILDLILYSWACLWGQGLLTLVCLPGAFFDEFSLALCDLILIYLFFIFLQQSGTLGFCKEASLITDPLIHLQDLHDYFQSPYWRILICLILLLHKNFFGINTIIPASQLASFRPSAYSIATHMCTYTQHTHTHLHTLTFFFLLVRCYSQLLSWIISL